jgi:hypothetical protein
MSEIRMRITSEELYAPSIEEYVQTQEMLQRAIGDIGEQPFILKLIYANWFYLALWSMVGAIVGWGMVEPFFNDHDDDQFLVAFLMFPTVAGCIGLFLGAAEGIMCRNAQRALTSGLVGLAVGFVGAAILFIPVGILFAITTRIAASLSKDLAEGEMPKGLALVVFMMGRALAWSLISIAAGIGQGLALRQKNIAFNGVIGGLLGGLIGGLLFDPINMLFTTADGQATLSRGIGFGTIGFAVGLFVGLVEGWTKTAWLLMRKGPLAGKQFVLYKDTTVLGSSPKAEIYLFKDDAIEPRHAIVYNRGGRFEIEDCQTPDGTYVNGVPIKRQYLKHGDQIVLGKTVLEFAVREVNDSLR